MKNTKLNSNEEAILKDFEAGNLKSVKNLDGEMGRYQKYAEYTLSKPRSINIRLSEKDLQKIKALAVEKGLPYQTLISSVLHQYSDKKIKEVAR